MTVVVPRSPSDFTLTEEQHAVVCSDATALVATASAGTGKTEILARRVERYLSDPSSGNANALVITYTTRAADEFKNRLRGRIGGSMQRVLAETVHGFAYSILSAHGSHVGLPTDFHVIVNDEDRAELLSEYEPLTAPEDCPELFRQLDLARAKCRSHPGLERWKAALASSGAVDYSEMLDKATEVLCIPAIARMMRVIYGIVIVDEAQNLTKQQYRLIAALVGKHAETGQPVVPTTLGALRRQLEISDSGHSPGDVGTTDSALAEALRAHADEHLDILVPLLQAESPSEFVDALEECELPESACDEELAGWHADRCLIAATWSEFIALTPVAERSWSRFALRVDWAQRARDLGAGLRLITVHKAQGREFKAVAIVGMNDGQFPDFRATSESAARAELQTFYVAATRASRVLQLGGAPASQSLSPAAAVGCRVPRRSTRTVSAPRTATSARPRRGRWRLRMRESRLQS